MSLRAQLGVEGRVFTLPPFGRGSNLANCVHAQCAFLDLRFRHSSISLEACLMTSELHYRGCKQISGSFSVIKLEHVHFIFLFFEDGVLVNDKDNESWGECGYPLILSKLGG